MATASKPIRKTATKLRAMSGDKPAKRPAPKRAAKKKPQSFKWQKMAGKNEQIEQVIKTLGQEKFINRAQRYDEEASFPFENYDDMRDAGILAMTVPKSLGGLGVEYADYALSLIHISEPTRPY